LVSAALPHFGQAGCLALASTPTSALNRFPQSSHVYSNIGIVVQHNNQFSIATTSI
jgi:hypothetical protein